jgi:hypothetical protein
VITLDNVYVYVGSAHSTKGGGGVLGKRGEGVVTWEGKRRDSDVGRERKGQ